MFQCFLIRLHCSAKNPFLENVKIQKVVMLDLYNGHDG